MDANSEKDVFRQHIITLAPDLLLFLVSLLFLLEMRMASAHKASTVRMLCEGGAIFFMSIGVAHVIKWFSFRLILSPTCIEIQQLLIFKKRYCLDGPRRFGVRTVQDDWDEWLNKGTLVIYEPGGAVATLDDIGGFDRIVYQTALHHRYLRFAP